MSSSDFLGRFRQLQRYVDWSETDADRVRSIADLVEPALPGLISDFYDRILGNETTSSIITGGPAQLQRLRGTLLVWIHDLLNGPYDLAYVERRWRVGQRHVELGLPQVFTNVALSRIRIGLIEAVHAAWAPEQGPVADLLAVTRSLDKLLDLDLAIIEDAYQHEYSARLQARERLATLGQVAGGLAHELRNPLNVIRTSVFYLENARQAAPEKRAEHLARIERQVARSDNVITALSNFARMPVPSLRPVPIATVIREALEAEAPGTKITVTTQFEPDLCPVLIDPDQVRIVFANLIRNACDAMPAGGTLLLTARQDGEHVEARVVDTGVGIGPEHLARIMEPLFSTKARGLGLGLAIARSILEKNQATIAVESELGHGTTFVTRFACTPAGAVPDAATGPR